MCLTDAQVCVDGGVAGGAGQVLVLAVRDVLVRSGVAVLLGEAEVDDVHQVALLTETHQEVVGLHVSVDEVLGVDVFNPADLEKKGGEQDVDQGELVLCTLILVKKAVVEDFLLE